MAISNLIGVGNADRTFTCAFDHASGGYQGGIRTLFDNSFSQSSRLNSSQDIWASVRGVVDPQAWPLVYVFIAVQGSTAKGYVGKAASTLSARYTAAGPNAGGLQQTFAFYANRPDIMNVTIYGTTHPCFIEGWCFQVAMNNNYQLFNIIDPN